jgi:hypothetical protein
MVIARFGFRALLSITLGSPPTFDGTGGEQRGRWTRSMEVGSQNWRCRRATAPVGGCPLSAALTDLT